jgi:hypothetical protein
VGDLLTTDFQERIKRMPPLRNLIDFTQLL